MGLPALGYIETLPPQTLAGRLKRHTWIIVLAVGLGLLSGWGAILFTGMIQLVTRCAVEPLLFLSQLNRVWLLGLCVVPGLGLLGVSWFTHRFAPESKGDGVPEVMLSLARHDGIIRPRVSLITILASGFTIGTGGSVGREGPIVQIGASLGSTLGQFFKLPPRDMKILVAAGAGAGISATFHAPLAGVVFACEVILGYFAIESLTPIVIACVLADVLQTHAGEYGSRAAFPGIFHVYHGAWAELPSYFALGLACGLVAVLFTKMIGWIGKLCEMKLPCWWQRALAMGCVVGIAGAVYPIVPPSQREAAIVSEADTVGQAGSGTHAPETVFGHEALPLPPLFGVGYEVVDHALHLENVDKQGSMADFELRPTFDAPEYGKAVRLDGSQLIAEFWWLLPLAFLKPIMTSITFGGGGSGGIFAPSMFVGATLGGALGILANLFLPDCMAANPGVYAIVGMGAVVAGTIHGTLSAILIVYETTHDYRIILPIMIAAGLAGVVARLIDPESIYEKKLYRQGGLIARGRQMHRFEHIMVRDVMIRDFPTLKPGDNLTEILRVARDNPHIECLPVMDESGKLAGIIRPGDLNRIFDSDVSPALVNAEDIALSPPIAVRTNANLLEAMSDFGAGDVETLPVEVGQGESRRVVGLLLRSDVMRRYRQEMLSVRG